jgi:hypothetical protein
MTILSKIGSWIVFSSSNPNKVGLTVKAALLGVITLLATFGFNTVGLPEGVDFFVQIVEQTLILVSMIFTFVGFVRKLYTSYKGTNAVVNADFR